ncbi:fungal-specific transcription factor domain-containing protein [Xylariales sp. PMI_506]|nr:fungal-specific transcription factor domain-containing protein [Xylariales sp. PMI_506]
MPIVRSRTGCFTCRRRKKKCNEAKPVCRGCERNGLQCSWPDLTASASASSHAAGSTRRHIGSSSSVTTSARPQAPPRTADRPDAVDAPADDADVEVVQRQPTAPRRHSSVVVGGRPAVSFGDAVFAMPTIVSSPSTASSCYDADIEQHAGGDTVMASSGNTVPLMRPRTDSLDSVANATVASSTSSSSNSSSGNDVHETQVQIQSRGSSSRDASMHAFAASMSIPGAMSILPHLGHESYELLGFYLSRTANSMGNGSTDVNPFVSKLIPLAFCSPLVLQLILAQSAAHRHVITYPGHDTSDIAQRCYNDSLRQFREVVGDYVSGREDNTLVLTVGSLILSLTEVAKGDTHGCTFDHLIGAKSLLSKLVSEPSPGASEDFSDFLIEYYIHMSALSMIAMDPQYTTHALVDPDIIRMGTNLVNKQYTGQLCGCWLELLLLIPQIFQLGQRMRANNVKDGVSAAPAPDDVIMFGFLQAQIMAFTPPSTVHPHTALAGLVFKQAVLLYLWTILGNPCQHRSETNMYSSLITGAVSEALSVLGQIPVISRINTSLCWPIAIIGNCIATAVEQQTVRDRLEAMLGCIGLGNMRETLVLLEHTWAQAPEDISPWTLCKCMQEHQIWISFA